MNTEAQAARVARAWIRKGRAVIPVPYGKKKPILENWSSLRVNDDSVDEFFNGKQQNIGLLLGEPSGDLVDVDLDCPEACQAAGHFLPATAVYGRAGNRRSHRLYISPESKTTTFSHAGTMLVEIRSTGAQSLVPPSVHPSGESYEFEKDTIAAVEMAAGALKSAVSRIAATALLAREWASLDGVRHTVSLALAGGLLDSGWDSEDVTSFIGAVVQVAGDEETGDRLRTVHDTFKRNEDDSETTGWNTLVEHLTEPVVNKLKKWLVLGGSGVVSTPVSADIERNEPEPLRRTAPPAEPYPVDALGSVLGPMVRAMMEIIQAPDAVCANSVLAAGNLAVQAHANIDIDGREHPLSSFFVTVAETGERKSASDKEALAPHNKRQQDMQAVYQLEMADYDAEQLAWKKAREESLSSKNNTSFESKKAALLELGPEPQQPANPILITEEPTYEGLIKALASGWPSMGLFSDEGGRFLGGHSMQRENQLKTAAGLSKLWDGSPITRTRSADGNMVLYGRRVSLHLMVQPNVSSLLFGNDLLMAQGLLSRCLVVHPTSRIGSRPYRQASLCNTTAAQRYRSRLSEIMEAPLPLADGTVNTL